MKQRDVDIVLNSPASWEKLKNSTVLVTGATGRLGIYIVNALLGANDRYDLNIKVLALARNEQKINHCYGDQLDRIQVLKQDVITPIEYEGTVDYIFHTAGLASPDDFTNRCVETLWGHVMGTRNVLELARTHNTKRILYVSTVEIYGSWKSEDYIKETDFGPLDHNNARACYPESKRLCETMLSCYKAQYGVDFTAVRMSHTLGPGISINDGRAFAEFLRNVINDEDIILQTDGSAVRTYTYVADAVGAMFLALLDGPDEYYNVANIDNQISIRDLATLIASLSKTGKTQVKFVGENLNGMQYLPFKLGILDTTRITSLGWKPTVNVENTFRYTLEDLLNE